MPFTRLLLPLALICAAGAAAAQSIAPRPGWAVQATAKSYDTLIADLKSAVKAQGLIVVTQAGPTKAAAARGITIPGNRVLGVFNNDYAVKVLETSAAAMIEAPIRFYVTEAPDGSATLSYKTPSHVFAPYLDEGGNALAALAAQLDGDFAAIAAAAAQ
jgi:uncharacterized protein (DUF302 family)